MTKMKILTVRFWNDFCFSLIAFKVAGEGQ